MVLCLLINAFCVLIIGERLALKIGGRYPIHTPPDHLKTSEIGLCRHVVFLHAMYLE